MKRSRIAVGLTALGVLSLAASGCGPSDAETSESSMAREEARQACIDRVNQYRAGVSLPPYARWTEAEACADRQAQHDAASEESHAAWNGHLCEPGGNAQNECPEYASLQAVVDECLAQMWAEGPGESFEDHGHYQNLASTEFLRAACGFYDTPQGRVWAVVNFGH